MIVWVDLFIDPEQKMSEHEKTLHDTDLPISNIIAEVGYTGKAHFLPYFS